MLQGDRRWECRLLAVSVVSSSLFCHPVPRFPFLAYAPPSEGEDLGVDCDANVFPSLCSLGPEEEEEEEEEPRLIFAGGVSSSSSSLLTKVPTLPPSFPSLFPISDEKQDLPLLLCRTAFSASRPSTFLPYSLAI